MLKCLQNCVYFVSWTTAVERRFSVNKELFVENLQQISLISQRLICDYFADFLRPIYEILLTNKMVKSFWLSHSRYIAALEKKRNATVLQFHKRKTSNRNLNLKRLLKWKKKEPLKQLSRVLKLALKSTVFRVFPTGRMGGEFPSISWKFAHLLTWKNPPQPPSPVFPQ